MAAFVKVDATTTPPSFKQASGTDYSYSVDQILTTLNGAAYAPAITVNPAVTTGLTLIGTFTDTYYPYTPGQHPVGTTITSVNYNFYQDQQTTTESITRPVDFSSGAINEQNDTSLNADLISTALANLVATGVGSYVLQPTTPTGGTWTSVATVTNNLDSTTSNVTYLWKKTAAASAPSTVRPAKVNATTPVSLKEMSDAEIQSLATRVKNRINSTGIGTYKIAGSTPVGGTWATAGQSFIDTSRTESTLSYSGTYASAFTGAYAGTYSQTFTGAYAGSYNQAFTGTYAGAYTGAFTGSYTGSYTGAYAGAYTRGFTGVYTRTFSGSYTGSYTGGAFYAGFKAAFFSGFIRGTAAFAGAYVGNYNVSYTGVYNTTYTGSYAGAYAGAYAGSYNQAFTGTYAGAYTKAFTGSYTGAYTGAFTGSYSGAYTGAFTGAYSGVTLNNDSTNVSTIYLWVRTA